MATVAPTPAGQGHQGDWYVPVLGMGVGMAAGQGMSRYGSIMDKFMESMRSAGIEGRAALPTTENIASYTGGVNAGGRGATAAKYAGSSMQDIVGMAESGNPAQAEQVARTLRDFPRVTSPEFKGNPFSPSRPDPGGGMVPRPDVLERVMNTGMRDKILGMGGVAGAVGLTADPFGYQTSKNSIEDPPGSGYHTRITDIPRNVEYGGRQDFLSRLLGIDYPGYKIVQANTGNASQNDQLRQLFGR